MLAGGASPLWRWIGEMPAKPREKLVLFSLWWCNSIPIFLVFPDHSSSVFLAGHLFRGHRPSNPRLRSSCPWSPWKESFLASLTVTLVQLIVVQGQAHVSLIPHLPRCCSVHSTPRVLSGTDTRLTAPPHCSRPSLCITGFRKLTHGFATVPSYLHHCPNIVSISISKHHFRHFQSLSHCRYIFSLFQTFLLSLELSLGLSDLA